jgi:hypothetical protein
MAAGYGLLLINKFPNCMASFQHGVLVPRLTWTFSGAILSNLMDAGHPCRHDEDLHFQLF